MKKKPLKRDHEIVINGKEVDDKTYKRLTSAPAPPARKEDLAQRPLHSVVRGFKLLR